jgi:hypothetical protein
MAGDPPRCGGGAPPLFRSSEPSAPLFSCGFTVDRITMILLSMSNQKGAPSDTANAVRSQPMTGLNACSHQ